MKGVQKMININVDVSEDTLTNSILNVSNGVADAKSIIVIGIFVASIGISILKHVMTTQERKQHEKIAEKAMLGWIKTGKHEKTYIDMIYRQYWGWTCIFIVCLFFHAFLITNLKINIFLVHIISRLAYVFCSCLYGKYLWKNVKIRENMKNRTQRKITSVLTFFGFFVTFNLMIIDNLFTVAEIIFGITVFIWIIFVFYDWESKYTYENKYAIVNTKEFGTIENVQAWNIKNYNGWISLFVCENGETQERRIKKEDIIGATYYGKPVVVTSNVKFFTTYNTLVEDQK